MHPGLQTNLGLLLENTGELDGLAACYERALELRPDFPLAHYNLGNLRWRQGLWTEAGAQYRRALEAGEQPPIRANLATVVHKLGRLDEALAALHRNRNRNRTTLATVRCRRTRPCALGPATPRGRGESAFSRLSRRPTRAEELHDLIAERYKTIATVVTANLDCREWGGAFPNKPPAP